MFGRVIAMLMFLIAGSTSAQRLLPTPDFTALKSGGNPVSPYISSFSPLPNGGYLVLGKFTTWYEGKEFRDALKLRADGLPDADWQALANNDMDGAIVLPDSVVLYGRFDYVNGVAARSPVRLSLTNAALLPFDRVSGAISTTPGGHDAASDWTYVISLMPMSSYQINRISAKSGAVDPIWQFTLPTNVNGVPGAPVADQQGGLWITWVEDQCFNSCFTSKMARFSIADPGRELIARLPTLFQRRPVFDGGFAYVGEYRYRISDGALDPTWKTGLNFGPTIDRGYLYVWTLTSTSTEVYYALRRAPLSGMGAFDDWKFDLPNSRFMAGEGNSVIIPYGPINTPNAVGVFTISSGSGAPRTLVVNGDLNVTQEATVVEYYATTVKRYFITGRKAEQDALDALPNAFVRTGIRFSAKSSRYRDSPEQPVCRMYASPGSGGSNSHFYGIGDDCPLLNKLTGLKYEGFDFSIAKATGAGCPADAPNAVSRLFNNKVTTNEGNHRYVVSEVTKAKMLAQGWIDEGPVFCSSSVVDAVLAN